MKYRIALKLLKNLLLPSNAETVSKIILLGAPKIKVVEGNPPPPNLIHLANKTMAERHFWTQLKKIH